MPDDIGAAIHRAASSPLGWRDRVFAALDKSDKGVVYPTVDNAMIALSLDPRAAGVLAYNEFKSEALLLASPPMRDGQRPAPGPYPRTWGAADVTSFLAYLQREWSPKFSKQTAEDAMLAQAEQNRFHPIRDWLDGLRWDGIGRLDGWLGNAFGCPEDTYHLSVAAKLLISAVRRVRQPGCKFDHMPILEGRQGIGKSTAVRTLFGAEHFSDSLPAALDNRDAAIGLLGVWALELAEIEHLIRAEVEVVKAFLSRAVDRYRPVHGRTYVERPRQGILIGTTNAEDYLRDSTGNRRFWPIRCRFAEPEWIADNREQLWAEAAAREAAGEAIWFADHEAIVAATEQQAKRLEQDVWTDRVRLFLGLRLEVTVPEVLGDCLLVPIERQGKREQMRVAAILAGEGYHRLTTWRGGKAKKLWTRNEGGISGEGG